MKQILILAAVFLTTACTTITPVTTGQGNTKGQQGVSNTSPIPNGVYYIVQVSSGEAVTPQGITQVTNEIYLKPFNKSGLQKWMVKRQGNGRYLFLPAANTDLYFTTFPDKPGWTAITDNRIGDSYTLKAVVGSQYYFSIHSKRYAGDALRDFLIGGYKEIKFVPLENNTRFYWKFIPAE